MANMTSIKHFIDISQYQPSVLQMLIDNAIQLKKDVQMGQFKSVYSNKVLGLIFEKPSTRTRISFEVGFRQLGGTTLCLSQDEIGIGQRESVQDVARVLSRYMDIVMIRNDSHEDLETFSRYATVPVINGLTNQSHPCQAMADMLTVAEAFGTTKGINITYIGDGNNVCVSLIELANRLGAYVTVSCPKGYEPQTEEPYTLVADPKMAVKSAQVVYTDVWTSMGQEDEYQRRLQLFKPYQVNRDLLLQAPQEAIVLHCLPAHRDEEITDEVMESSQSKVFDQAENRMHAQKAIIQYLLG